MKVINILFLIFFLCPTAFLNLSIAKNKHHIENSSYKNDTVNISIKSSKDVYLESEAIWIEYLTIIDKNMIVFDEAPYIQPYGDLKFSLKNSKNELIKYIGGQGGRIHSDYYPDTSWDVFNLLNFYGFADRFQYSQLHRKFYLPEGRYTIQAYLSCVVKNQEVIFTSNTISFSVLKPLGVEEEAHEKLLDIYKQGGKMEYEEIKIVVSEFDSTYKNSVYTSNAKYFLFTWSFIDSNYKNYAKDFLIDLINSNPDSYYNFSYINSLRKYTESSEEYENLLKILDRKYFNTITNKFIKYRINGHIDIN
ncbi:MAG: hypothetical protein WAT71_17735 [Ignavibacteria bacterium]